jgi:prevent-host-death family protein
LRKKRRAALWFTAEKKVKKEIDKVVTRNYSQHVKTKETKYKITKSEPMVLREVAVASGIGEIINVRSAKTHLSALLEWVAGGHEITITSDGKPKAKLIPVMEAAGRRTFQGMGDFLLRQPIHGGPSAEDIIREDRDSRGW